MKFLKPALVALVALGILAVWSSRARGELSAAAAREYVKRGALVVDVRTVEEFNTKRLTNVINIPLDAVKEKFPVVVTNKSDVVLLHCRTGRRSGIAEGELRALGYTNVFNIGSFERAGKILAGAGPQP
jgi:phage shock protein E